MSDRQLLDLFPPFIALTRLQVETFSSDQLPHGLAGQPAIKPGSK